MAWLPRLQSLVRRIRLWQLPVYIAHLHPDAEFIIFVTKDQMSDVESRKFTMKRQVWLDNDKFEWRGPNVKIIRTNPTDGPLPTVYELQREVATEKLTR